jgi:hypothetical protein
MIHHQQLEQKSNLVPVCIGAHIKAESNSGYTTTQTSPLYIAYLPADCISKEYLESNDLKNRALIAIDQTYFDEIDKEDGDTPFCILEGHKYKNIRFSYERDDSRKDYMNEEIRYLDEFKVEGKIEIKNHILIYMIRAISDTELSFLRSMFVSEVDIQMAEQFAYLIED